MVRTLRSRLSVHSYTTTHDHTMHSTIMSGAPCTPCTRQRHLHSISAIVPRPCMRKPWVRGGGAIDPGRWRESATKKALHERPAAARRVSQVASTSTVPRAAAAALSAARVAMVEDGLMIYADQYLRCARKLERVRRSPFPARAQSARNCEEVTAVHPHSARLLDEVSAVSWQGFDEAE